MDPHSEPPQVVTEWRDMHRRCLQLRREGKRLGLVPTMGALHEGHLSLARASHAECDATAVTVFVNPTQFGPGEDLQRYPRDLAGDVASLAPLGVDFVFAPDSAAMYAPGASTFVEPPTVAQRWEGACRPGHFRGVATIVLKLFHVLPADVAYFGQKDYQQSLVIRRMVDDLNVPIDIRVCPIVREADGLALSSRNAFLDERQRRQALALSKSLEQARAMVAGGERRAGEIERAMRAVFEATGIDEIDYIALADRQTLEPLSELSGPAVALVAVRVGQTRLIDNMLLG